MVGLPMAEVDVFGIFKGSLLLIALVLVLFVVVTAIRKWMKNDEYSVGAGFTLAELRELHKNGKMTTEEFEKARDILLATLGKVPAKAQAGGFPVVHDKPSISPPIPPSDSGLPPTS
jgi:hypothetical protein